MLRLRLARLVLTADLPTKALRSIKRLIGLRGPLPRPRRRRRAERGIHALSTHTYLILMSGLMKPSYLICRYSTTGPSLNQSHRLARRQPHCHLRGVSSELMGQLVVDSRNRTCGGVLVQSHVAWLFVRPVPCSSLFRLPLRMTRSLLLWGLTLFTLTRRVVKNFLSRISSKR